MSIKKFRIVLDGVAHEVEVEDLGGVSAPSAAAPAPKAASAAPAPKAAAPAAPKAAAPATGAGAITAPLQGTVLDVAVSAGQQVKAGQVLVILEAMKMENEIVAPGDGAVVSVAVHKGDAVAAGDLLVTLQ